jgi:hypothetical protein
MWQVGSYYITISSSGGNIHAIVAACDLCERPTYSVNVVLCYYLQLHSCALGRFHITTKFAAVIDATVRLMKQRGYSDQEVTFAL